MNVREQIAEAKMCSQAEYRIGSVKVCKVKAGRRILSEAIRTQKEVFLLPGHVQTKQANVIQRVLDYALAGDCSASEDGVNLMAQSPAEYANIPMIAFHVLESRGEFRARRRHAA